MNLHREARQRREVPKRPAADHRNVGLGKGGEIAQGDRRLAQRQRLHRIGNDRGDRAVVVTGDQEMWGLCEQTETLHEFRIVQQFARHGSRR